MTPSERRRRGAGPWAALVLLAAALGAAAGCGGPRTFRVRAPGPAPDLREARRGDVLVLELESATPLSGELSWVSHTRESHSVGGPLEGGGSLSLSVKGRTASGMIRPARGKPRWLPPTKDGIGTPRVPAFDEGGPCGTVPRPKPPVPAPGPRGLHPPPTPVPDAPAEAVHERSLTPPETEEVAESEPDPEPTTIRVAFLYSDGIGVSELPDPDAEQPDQLFLESLAKANTAMASSGLAVVFEFAGWRRYTYTPPAPGDPESVVTVAGDVGTPGSAGAQQVTSVRNDLAADVVCIVTVSVGQVAGMAPQIDQWGNQSAAWIEDRAHIVIRKSNLQSNTFAHEAAHLLGSGHQHGADSPPQAPQPTQATQNCYSVAWIFDAPNPADPASNVRYATVECQPAPPGQMLGINEVLLSYSTPSVLQMGVPTGEDHDAECNGESGLVTWTSTPRPKRGADSVTTFKFTAPLLAAVR